MFHEIEKTNNQPQRRRDTDEKQLVKMGDGVVGFSPRLRVSAVRFIFLILPILLLLTGCYRTITGTVVDAETGKPIEGAVILAEWTTSISFGFSRTDSQKVVEAVTDKNGKATISGNFTINPLVNRPSVTVYKKGYVAWNNEYIFPDYKKRTDFSWGNGYVFKLERFKDSYSYAQHMSFVTNAIHTNLETKDKQFFLKQYYAAEMSLVIDEDNKKIREER